MKTELHLCSSCKKQKQCVDSTYGYICEDCMNSVSITDSPSNFYITNTLNIPIKDIKIND